jgi:hypothetical protein
MKFKNSLLLLSNVQDHMEVGTNSASVLVANIDESSEITCICCAELELELEKTRIELRSTQKIVELLREEMYSATLEVRNNTNGGCRNSGSDSPHKGYKRTQEQRNRHSGITEEVKAKFKDNNMLYLRREQENDRQDEDCVASWTQQMEVDLEEDNSWIKVTPKGLKRRMEGNKKKSDVKNNSQNENMTYIERNSPVTNELQEKTNKKSTAQYNCKNLSSIRQETKLKAGMVTYTIPSIINGRLSR